ncbi:MAG: hypothetical protein R2838_08930 [Caldilineaceae bacterium]
MQPYSVSHNVTHGDWGDQGVPGMSRRGFTAGGPFQLASYIPGGILPSFVSDANTAAGRLHRHRRRAVDGTPGHE